MLGSGLASTLGLAVFCVVLASVGFSIVCSGCGCLGHLWLYLNVFVFIRHWQFGRSTVLPCCISSCFFLCLLFLLLIYLRSVCINQFQIHTLVYNVVLYIFHNLESTRMHVASQAFLYLILYYVLFGGTGGMERWWRRRHRTEALDGTVWLLEEDEEGVLLLPALACGVLAEAKRRQQAAEGTASSSGREGTGGARDTASGREGTTSQQPQQQPIPQQQPPRQRIIYCHGPLNPLPTPQQRQLPQQPPQPKRMPDHNHNNRQKRRAQEYGRSREGAGGGVLRGVCSEEEEEEQEEEDKVEDYSYEDDKKVEQDESLMKTRKRKITVMRIM